MAEKSLVFHVSLPHGYRMVRPLSEGHLEPFFDPDAEHITLFLWSDGSVTWAPREE